MVAFDSWEIPPPMATTLNICRIDCHDDARRRSLNCAGNWLRNGNVVSPQGRARTLAAFGEELTPQQVIERIRRRPEPRSRRRARVHGKLDGVTLSPAEVRVTRRNA